MIEVRSSWTVEDGWALPFGRKNPGASPRVEAAPSLRGTPPAGSRTTTAQERREKINAARKRRIAAGGRW